MSTLIVFWQFILKVLEEVTIVSNPFLSLEMLVIRLSHLKDIPSYESVLGSINQNNLAQDEKGSKTIELNQKKKFINEDKQISKISKDQVKNTTQAKPELLQQEESTPINKNIFYDVNSFEDLISLSSKQKEIQLKYDLEKNVNLVKFSQGKIDISFNENLDKNFVRNLSEKLFTWTGVRWVITLTKEQGRKTFFETREAEKKEFLEKEKKSEVYKKFKNVFSDVELLEVKKKD